MTDEVANTLKEKRCVPCEGGVPKLSRSESTSLLKSVEGWVLSDDSNLISREWTVKNFAAAMAFLNDVAVIAEEENHHPDFHLTGYRNIRIELTTHAIQGLSENDFIVAAKINEVPVKLKS
ncbi:4a-hydroxytetrahydrobiopterin dehydratase [Planctomicrobium sp. SH527]|uniref:4a-hydroxytetrahydrobiopterin dehydratase n=1 Tax=Planctomicrobium sp. SH527 TaxID=3448123 RepID=UPI003F5C3E51